jgi:hypothetical protein
MVLKDFFDHFTQGDYTPLQRESGAMMNTLERLTKSIANRQGTVILRSELRNLGSYSQVSRSLEELVQKGKLVRVGRGIFVKTRISSLTGRPVAAGTLESVATETLKKMGIKVSPGNLTREYNRGKSTQLPMQFVVNTGARRISRKISVGGRTLMYENDFSQA